MNKDDVLKMDEAKLSVVIEEHFGWEMAEKFVGELAVLHVSAKRICNLSLHC